MSVYLRLMHGREHPEQALTDCGFSGPALGPFSSVHVIYRERVICKPQDPKLEDVDLVFYNDFILHDGKYYGVFEVVGDLNKIMRLAA